MLEIIKDGKPKTSFLKFDDIVTIEMKNKDGNSIFGEIKQKVTQKK